MKRPPSVRADPPEETPGNLQPSSPGRVILDAFDTWRAWPLKVHLASILLLSSVAALRWWEPISFAGPRFDERIYLEAARFVLDGLSPYEQPVFLYPPAFAFVLAVLLELIGQAWVLAALRTLNLLGLGIVVWISMAWVPVGWAWRMFVGVAAIGLVSGIHLGLMVGNLSFLIGATILGPLLLWRHYPILSGLVLGIGTALKPLAAVVIVLLALHRPARPGWQGLCAGAVAGLVAGGLFLTFPYLSEFLQLGRQGVVPFDRSPFDRTVSLHRWLLAWGLPLGPAATAAAVAVSTVVLGRLRAWSQLELVCLGVAAMTVAAPALWPHSMLVTLPIQAAALSLAAWRNSRSTRNHVHHTADPGTRAPVGGHLEFALVLLGLLAIQLSDHIGSLSMLPPSLQVLLLIPPTFAPAALAAYVIWNVSPRR